MEIKPYWKAAQKPGKKGQKALLNAAIRHLKAGNTPAALACLLTLRTRLYNNDSSDKLSILEKRIKNQRDVIKMKTITPAPWPSPNPTRTERNPS